MAFKLMITIDDNHEVDVAFDGKTNHFLLLGVLEMIKSKVIVAADEGTSDEPN